MFLPSEIKIPALSSIPFVPLSWLVVFLAVLETLARLLVCFQRPTQILGVWQSFKLPLSIAVAILTAKLGSSLDIDVPSMQDLLSFLGASIVYLFWRMSNWNMTAKQCRDLRHGKLGYGLAQGFFSFLENALSEDEAARREQEFRRYVEAEGLDGRHCSSVGSMVPLVLFPDLTSYLVPRASGGRRGNDGGRWTIGDDGWFPALISGVVKSEEREELETRRTLFYGYTDQAEQKRGCYYEVFSVERTGDGDRGLSYRYFFVIDNRPLMALQQWYEEQEDVSEAELDLQQRLYKRQLERHLQVSNVPEGNYAILEFKKGEFLDALANFLKREA